MSDSDQGYAWEASFIPYTKGIIRQLNVSVFLVATPLKDGPKTYSVLTRSISQVNFN